MAIVALFFQLITTMVRGTKQLPRTCIDCCLPDMGPFGKIGGLLNHLDLLIVAYVDFHPHDEFNRC
jgi:hypothetical protein